MLHLSSTYNASFTTFLGLSTIYATHQNNLLKPYDYWPNLNIPLHSVLSKIKYSSIMLNVETYLGFKLIGIYKKTNNSFLYKINSILIIRFRLK